mgnify:CR=1 FL=1|tara:strand:+ start:356 stop:712 length:357 start_codon:yes stop_codon:yes gene_type:complete
MKKITLTIALATGIMFAKAQDTTCTYFTGKRVIEFDYYQDTILHEKQHVEKYHDIKVKFNDVLCLHLADEKNRVRTVIVTYFDNYVSKQVLDSKNHIYFSPLGVVKVSVGKPKLAIKL